MPNAPDTGASAGAKSASRREELRRLVEDGLARLLDERTPGTPERLLEALRYSLLSGGKRVRPVLCLAAAEAVRGKVADALPAALAIEILHTYTLVHDDLPCMDDDALRRGQPTVHVKFGEAEAVLAGDALQALAFQALARLRIPPDRAFAALAILAGAAGPAGVVGGQWEDVTARPPHTPERVAYVHLHKTADLIACAAQLGGVCGGGTPGETAALREFGVHLGVAFQIVDDLLDEPGRGAKADPELSCLDIWTPDAARLEADRHTKLALAALGRLSGKTDALRDLAWALLDRKR